MMSKDASNILNNLVLLCPKEFDHAFCTVLIRFGTSEMKKILGIY